MAASASFSNLSWPEIGYVAEDNHGLRAQTTQIRERVLDIVVILKSVDHDSKSPFCERRRNAFADTWRRR